MAHIGKGGFDRSYQDNAKGYTDSQVAHEGQRDAAVPRDARTAPDSPMDLSSSVASPSRFPLVKPHDPSSQLQKAARSLRPAPAPEFGMRDSDSEGDKRTMGDGADKNGGDSSSANPPNAVK